MKDKDTVVTHRSSSWLFYIEMAPTHQPSSYMAGTCQSNWIYWLAGCCWHDKAFTH